MFKKIGENIWSIEPPPYPKDLDINCQTVLKLASIDFVYQGFDGNFHYFIHRYGYRQERPNKNCHCFEEILVYRTQKSIIIGYADSYYDGGICSYYNFLSNVVEGGVGLPLFELQVKELQDLEKEIIENKEMEINSLTKPTSFNDALRYDSKKTDLIKKYSRINQFFKLANINDFKV
ncbi:hypothetical protein [Chryseobacterium sp.]|uniref:hypothetical protein n=1 Tax=Chryseobacterium sp. TaxID=1871047 RepID=UPI002FCB13F6